jgi:diketogulonate reductase-like aldo/keto reductase
MSAKFTITDKLHMPKCATRIPRLGFGVYESHADQCVASCTTALKVGYRHIDTAQYYANEAEVGTAVRQSGLKRADVFITTKILAAAGSFAKTVQKCLESVDKIDGGKEGGYVDCFLIHSPSGGKEKRREMWQALEKLYELGKAKSIGVSNFGVGHIEEMKSYAKVWPPHVNQIEVSFPCGVSRASSLAIVVFPSSFPWTECLLTFPAPARFS